MKQPDSDDPSSCKNSYNNPAYYILEGVPNQSAAALSPELLPSSASSSASQAGKAPPQAGARTKPLPGSSSQQRRHTSGQPVRTISEEGSSEDDVGGAAVGGGATLNRPPPDFPPPPLPKAAQETAEPKPRPLYPDMAEVRIPSANPSPSFVLGDGFRRGGGGALDDQSCSVLQMAKTLSESEFPPQPPRDPSEPPPHPTGQGAGPALGDPRCPFPPPAPGSAVCLRLPLPPAAFTSYPHLVKLTGAVPSPPPPPPPLPQNPPPPSSSLSFPQVKYNHSKGLSG